MKISEKIDSISSEKDLKKFVKELDFKISFWKGRKFYCRGADGEVSFNSLISMLYKKCAADPALIRPSIIGRLNKLNQTAEDALRKRNCMIRAMTALKRCFSPSSWQNEMKLIEKLPQTPATNYLTEETQAQQGAEPPRQEIDKQKLEEAIKDLHSLFTPPKKRKKKASVWDIDLEGAEEENKRHRTLYNFSFLLQERWGKIIGAPEEITSVYFIDPYLKKMGVRSGNSGINKNGKFVEDEDATPVSNKGAFHYKVNFNLECGDALQNGRLTLDFLDKTLSDLVSYFTPLQTKMKLLLKEDSAFPCSLPIEKVIWQGSTVNAQSVRFAFKVKLNGGKDLSLGIAIQKEEDLDLLSFKSKWAAAWEEALKKDADIPRGFIFGAAFSSVASDSAITAEEEAMLKEVGLEVLWDAYKRDDAAAVKKQMGAPYRKTSLKLHPDRGGDNARFQVFSSAITKIKEKYNLK